MAKNGKTHGFQVIQGIPSSSVPAVDVYPERPRARLHALGPVRPIPAQQLALPWIGPAKRTVVSIGMHGLNLSTLTRLLKVHEIRAVADIRVSPSFRGPDFDTNDIFDLLGARGITYRRYPALANKFVGESLNPSVVLDMYEKYLTTREDALRELHRAIDSGPIGLLGWDAHHPVPSEQSILIDALARLGNDFELISPLSGR